MYLSGTRSDHGSDWLREEVSDKSSGVFLLNMHLQCKTRVSKCQTDLHTIYKLTQKLPEKVSHRKSLYCYPLQTGDSGAFDHLRDSSLVGLR